MKNLANLKTLGQNNPESMKAFDNLNKAVFKDGAIPLKYKELIAVAIAVSKQCVYCMEVHKANAKGLGVTEEEISEAVFIAAAIGAGASVTHGTHVLQNLKENQNE